jgi:membrane protease YdiL (CAAX protease family)
MEARQQRWADSRSFSALELLVGSAVVIAHNVFHLIPSEVVVLTVLGLVSARLRNGGLAALGFRRPESWSRILLIAIAAAVLRILLGELVTDPITSQFWPEAKAPEGIEDITGNLQTAAFWLFIVWTWAAFGEEIAYRGYLLRRAADLGRGSTAAYLIGAVFVAILFGYGHYYKGPAGIIDSGVAGLILAAAFLVARRNLWAPILAHGFIDTISVVALYFGWDS